MISITDQEFRQIAEYMRTHCGVFLKEEKKALVIGRLQQVLVRENMSSFSEYYRHLLEDKTGKAAAVLVDKLTTHHTYFMREPEHFRYFRDHVFPYLRRTVKDRDLRIWSAACSTGEEPYTLAMLLDEGLGGEKEAWDARVLATDISAAVLAAAEQGIYANDKLEPLPAGWRLRYFQPCGESRSRLVDAIRRQVIFRKLNLMEPVFPFRKKFHVIFCRNVMIYFDPRTRQELVDKLYQMTEYGGWLFIGQSETLNRDATPYRYVLPSVYRKC